MHPDLFPCVLTFLDVCTAFQGDSVRGEDPSWELIVHLCGLESVSAPVLCVFKGRVPEQNMTRLCYFMHL